MGMAPEFKSFCKASSEHHRKMHKLHKGVGDHHHQLADHHLERAKHYDKLAGAHVDDEGDGEHLDLLRPVGAGEDAFANASVGNDFLKNLLSD